MTIWVDAWQLQCCGDPFRLGSQVAWTLRDADPDWFDAVLGAGALTVDAAEEHHGGVPEDTEPVRGTVKRISAVHCRYAPKPDGGPQAHYPVPGSCVLTDVKSADGRTADRGEERFVGYVVRLVLANRQEDLALCRQMHDHWQTHLTQLRANLWPVPAIGAGAACPEWNSARRAWRPRGRSGSA